MSRTMNMNPTPSAIPNSQEIASRAHQLWEREGRPDGHAEEHWLAAEKEIRTERQATVGSGHGRERDRPMGTGRPAL